jgi:hypothetical protein
MTCKIGFAARTAAHSRIPVLQTRNIGGNAKPRPERVIDQDAVDRLRSSGFESIVRRRAQKTRGR